MGKQRKTRQEKIISELRKKLVTTTDFSSPTITTTKSISLSHLMQPTAVATSPSVKNYAYVLHDIRKTAFLTISILVGEMVLYFLFVNHIIKLSIVSF